MNTPFHVKLRRYIASGLNTLLSKSTDITTKEHLNIDEIKTIMIVRPNYRIGNLLFLTPLINDLSVQIPNAKIDIIVGMKLAGDILESLPNVNQVLNIPRKLLLHPVDMYNLIKSTRTKKYDLTINIAQDSISSQLVTSLVNAKYKASFHNEKNWTNLTHSIEKKMTYMHMGLQNLEFLRLFSLKPLKDSLQLDIKLLPEEIETAKIDLNHLLKDTIVNKDTKIISIFRNARLDKKIEDKWWEQWFKELKLLNNNIIVIDILSPDILTKLNNNVLEYSNKNLRILGAFFNQCDLFVSADTGPMHLATASSAKVLALFNKTNIQVYGALGEKNKTIDINSLSTKDVAQITKDFL